MSKENEEGMKNPNELLKEYLEIYLNGRQSNDELEIKFGNNKRNPITKITFNTIVEKLKSLGFSCDSVENYLNINSEYVDARSGRKTISNIRTKISNIHNIKNYCTDNKLNLEDVTNSQYITFIQKFRKEKGNRNGGEKLERLFPIDFYDFEFRVNYKSERDLKINSTHINNLTSNWDDSKKIFRLFKRLTFQHPDYPFKFDISIVRSSKKVGKHLISEYNIKASNVFNNPETYEVEMEFDNKKAFACDINKLHSSFRRGVKIMLSAIQNTNYPVSYKEQRLVLQEYKKIIYNQSPPKRDYVKSSEFIGPSSISLEIVNTIPIEESNLSSNINQPYTVTEKADGLRSLLIVSSIGKIYLLNHNMKIMFTGCITKNESCWNSILDGERVELDKNNNYINYFLCFDIYYINNKSVMEFPFTEMEGLVYPKKMPTDIFRYKSLIDFTQSFAAEGITTKKPPLTIKPKVFYKNTRDSIFTQCNQILSKVEDGEFNYWTDGLVFTPINTGVGSNIIGETFTPKKKTWYNSFKWKPPEHNTIDFLVSTKKDERGHDAIGTEFTDGLNLSRGTQVKKYKTLILRVGFDERNSKHAYPNPFKSVIEDDLPNTVSWDESLYKPARFQPTNPTPSYAAYLCNIYLTDDGKMTIEDGTEFFKDSSIVEFRFSKEQKKHWQWKPIKVRNDKTAEYRKSSRPGAKKEYGNAYHVANSVWKSIHNPVTENMIRTGAGIQMELADNDVYYKSNNRDTITQPLRNFHNLVVKKSLILGVAKRGNTLIDQTVGKAGDFPKWKYAKLSFVFGIDHKKDNIENRLDGACARYLGERLNSSSIPKVIYLHGDSSLNIRDGDAFKDVGTKKYARAIFGQGPKEKTLGNGVYKQYGKGLNGFDIVSNQFSIHYFFGNNINLNNFLRNVSECCKVGGYFIGTCYDGKKVFNQLKNKEKDESISIIHKDIKMWEVTKEYKQSNFNDDESCLGYQISVYQESINKSFPEYLVNFDYLTRLIENYGFTPLTPLELKKIKFKKSIGSFSLLFDEFISSMDRRSNKKGYGEAAKLSEKEKKISFLNNYFIYKKRRSVPAESVFNSIVKNTKKKKKFKFKKIKRKIKLSVK